MSRLQRLALFSLVTTGAIVSSGFTSAPSFRPITSVAALEKSELFESLRLTLDSSASTAAVRVYRPGSKAMARRLTVRMDVAAGGVLAARFGAPPAVLRQMAMLLRDPLAGFVTLALPAADTTAYAAELVQIRNDMMGAESDTAFLARDTADKRMPQRPTPLYLTLLNRRAVASVAHGASQLRVENVTDGRDTATVITVAAADFALAPLAPAEWLARPDPQILGGTLADFEGSVIAEAITFTRGQVVGAVVPYVGVRNGDTAMTAEVHLDSLQRIDRMALTMREMAGKASFAEMGAKAVFSMLPGLIPTADSADAKRLQMASLLGGPGPDQARAQRLLRVIRKQLPFVVYDFAHSSVLAEVANQRDLVITVAPPGAFASRVVVQRPASARRGRALAKPQ